MFAFFLYVIALYSKGLTVTRVPWAKLGKGSHPHPLTPPPPSITWYMAQSPSCCDFYYMTVLHRPNTPDTSLPFAYHNVLVKQWYYKWLSHERIICICRVCLFIGPSLPALLGPYAKVCSARQLVHHWLPINPYLYKGCMYLKLTFGHKKCTLVKQTKASVKTVYMCW